MCKAWLKLQILTLLRIQMQRKMLIQIQNIKPVKMVECLTEVAIHAFPHHCRIEVFAEKRKHE